MLQPMQQNVQRVETVTARAVPPPIGGWNARDADDLMDPADAIQLDNWFPRTNDVKLRRGSAPLTTSAMGSGAAVKTLAELKVGTVAKLVAASGGKIYDATLATPVELATGYTEDRWQTMTFKGLLFACNGTDAPWTYDGSTFDSTTGFTGPTLTDLIYFAHHAERIFAVQKNSTSFWYGGVGSITGALTEFDLETIAKKGGTLNSIGVITSDGGVSSEDLVCFFMSTGEVIVYQGSNPGDASAWGKVGSFTIGAPLVRQNNIQVGADLVCMSKDGFIPLAQVLPFGRSRDEDKVLSDKIRGAVSEAIRDYGANEGWQIAFYPVGDMLVFNIPTSATTAHQYVMNLNTLAWCRFTGLNAQSWATFNDNLYFGDNAGLVHQADTGTADNGSNIVAEGATAFNYFDDRSREKQFVMARPIFSSDGALTLTLALNVDFDTSSPLFTVTSPQSGPIWDAAIWDAELWGGGLDGSRGWQSVANIGYAASLKVGLSTATRTATWNSTTYAMIFGSIL